MSIISNENKFRMSSPSIGSFDYKNPYQKYNPLVNADIIYIYILHTSNPTTAIYQITKMVPYTKSMFNKKLLQTQVRCMSTRVDLPGTPPTWHCWECWAPLAVRWYPNLLPRCWRPGHPWSRFFCCGRCCALAKLRKRWNIYVVKFAMKYFFTIWGIWQIGKQSGDRNPKW